MGAAGLKVRKDRKQEGMRVRGAIHPGGMPNASGSWPRHRRRGRGASGSLVRHGWPDVGASTGSNRDAGLHRRACSGKPMGNELQGESGQRVEKLSVRSAIGRVVGGQMAAETGERTRPLGFEVLAPRETS